MHLFRNSKLNSQSTRAISKKSEFKRKTSKFSRLFWASTLLFSMAASSGCATTKQFNEQMALFLNNHRAKEPKEKKPVLIADLGTGTSVVDARKEQDPDPEFAIIHANANIEEAMMDKTLKYKINLDKVPWVIVPESERLTHRLQEYTLELNESDGSIRVFNNRASAPGLCQSVSTAGDLTADYYELPAMMLVQYSPEEMQKEIHEMQRKMRVQEYRVSKITPEIRSKRDSEQHDCTKRCEWMNDLNARIRSKYDPSPRPPPGTRDCSIECRRTPLPSLISQEQYDDFIRNLQEGHFVPFGVLLKVTPENITIFSIVNNQCKTYFVNLNGGPDFLNPSSKPFIGVITVRGSYAVNPIIYVYDNSEKRRMRIEVSDDGRDIKFYPVRDLIFLDTEPTK